MPYVSLLQGVKTSVVCVTSRFFKPEPDLTSTWLCPQTSVHKGPKSSEAEPNGPERYMVQNCPEPPKEPKGPESYILRKGPVEGAEAIGLNTAGGPGEAGQELLVYSRVAP